MSSSYIVEPRESDSKKDDTLIIVVNDDGTISVDQETLQNLIMNQSNANVSVVRVGQTEADGQNGDLTFTVDPPAFVTSDINPTPTTTTPDIVDPFMEMDPEQLERLETALQSEQAKQILGENVTAMLDMLTVEEQQNSIRYSIELDHCYTSRTSPADPPPLDPLPVSHSPDVEKLELPSTLSSPTIHPAPPPEETTATIPIKTPLKKPVGRPRKTPLGLQPTPSVPDPQKTSKLQEEDSNSQPTTSDSSESDPSDDDLDFGPRGPRRSGVRARGGRKGLTTRGGTMTGRRPGRPSKMDIEQVRRLNMEMAAAVDEMKPPKSEIPDNSVRPKKQIRTMGGKKKEEPVPVVQTVSIEPPPSPEKPLQTTNQVKANLINANMIKGDMILTKPGQSRNNQKVYFVQKKIVMKASEIKNLGVKKSAVVITKGPVKMVNQVQTKLATCEDGKLINVVNKSIPVIQAPVVPSTTAVIDEQPPEITPVIPEVIQPPPKPPVVSPVKVKPVIEVKKDKREKLEKSDIKEKPLEIPKTVELKTPEKNSECKKHVKKETKKSPAVFVEALGPALFSTPDIIRRVGSVGEAKAPEHEPLNTSTEAMDTSLEAHMTPIKDDLTSLRVDIKPQDELLDQPADVSGDVHGDTSGLMETDNVDEKGDEKQSVTDDLNAVLDPGGIEGNEHFLATLEMEATKHEEELLAEALLLQEQLDVDLSDSTVLDGSAVSATLPSPLLSPSDFDPALLTAPVSPQKPPEPPAPLPTPPPALTNDPKKKESKEPIQIVRGGRVITLPPIEAPATRSKRLQSKNESPPKSHEIMKKEEKSSKPSTPKKIEEMDSEMEDEDEDENSDSEDDPNRLWCICKRPHNNRFMICCDVCEDWFHGKCVHVSKAMGQQMEEQGIEWVCPNCSKKKSDDIPSTQKSQKTNNKSNKVEGEKPVNVKQNNPPEIMKKPVKSEVEKETEQKLEVVQTGGITQCVVCKKEARTSSIYCSDVCILAHAQESSKEKPSQVISKISKDGQKTDPRVIVFDRKACKILSGNDAPTKSNLQNWLKEHPTFEPVRSNSLNTIQLAGKTVTAIQSPGTKSQKTSSSPQVKMVYAKVAGSKQTALAPSHKKITIVSPHTGANKPQVKQFLTTSNKNPQILKQITTKTVPQTNKSPGISKQQTKKNEPKPSTSTPRIAHKSGSRRSELEPIRLNVRKSVTDVLSTRIKETDDLKLTDDEIKDLALNIELEMYKYFRDTGAKYKAKYRSLVFNIKDTKNLTLFRKIADRSLTPDAVVRLSPEEMASQELAEWREKETKHQLEMIKKNELDLMAQAKSIVVKTHKGEQIIENDGGLDAVDPKTPVQDIVTALNSADNTSSDILEEKEETTSSSVEDSRLKASKHEEKKKKKDKERDKDAHRSREKEHKESKRDRSSSRSRRHRSRDRSRDRRKSKDGKREKDREHSHRDKDKDKEKDKDHERSKEKEKMKEKDKDRSRRSSKSSRKSSHKDSHKEKEKKRNDSEDEKKKDKDDKKKETQIQPEKPIEDRLWRHVEEETNTTNTLDGNDSDVSDREPSSTVNIKTPDINEELEKDKEVVISIEQPPQPVPPVNTHKDVVKGQQTVWRGFVNMNDVAKFFITAQEISGHAKDLMDDLPDTIDVVGRISPETVWDYMSKMKKNGSKEILVIRLTAANDEEKIPYITLYSYLNSRSRLGVIGSVSNYIKDFYIMPFSSHSRIPQILVPLIGPGFEENRPHLLLGIIIRNKRKRPSTAQISAIPSKVNKKDTERSYTPPPTHSKEKISSTLEKSYESHDKSITQTLNSLDKAAISKIVPELSSKFDLTSSDKPSDDDDEPYSPGGIDDDNDDSFLKNLSTTSSLLPSPINSAKNSTEIQRKVEELNRQIEEQKQQIQSISSSFLGESVATLPGLGLDPPGLNQGDDEAYSPTDARSFTPPPQGIPKFAQPILDKVQDITIPANLQEILANVKRQESTKVDPYLPSKPGASFLTSVNTSMKPEKSYIPTVKENKSTLRSLSDLDLIKKAEEELKAVEAASGGQSDQNIIPSDSIDANFSLNELLDIAYQPSHVGSASKGRVSDQPKPPGLEDEELPIFPSTPPNIEGSRNNQSPKYVPKSGVVLSVKRKIIDDGSAISPSKTPRTKSRWGQGPSD